MKDLNISCDLIEEGTEEQLAALFAAFAAARPDIPHIKKSRKVSFETRGGGSVEYPYAPLYAMVEATSGPLAKQGLSVTQPFSIAEERSPHPLLGVLAELKPEPDLLRSMLPMLLQTRLVGRIRTILAHKDGARLISTVEFTPLEDIKKMGAQTTYLRRYAYQSMLGIDGERDADDGPSEELQEPRRSQEPPAPKAAKEAVPQQDAGDENKKLKNTVKSLFKACGITSVKAMSDYAERTMRCKVGSLDREGWLQLKALLESDLQDRAKASVEGASP